MEALDDRTVARSFCLPVGLSGIIGRGARIRTGDLLRPRQPAYSPQPSVFQSLSYKSTTWLKGVVLPGCGRTRPPESRLASFSATSFEAKSAPIFPSSMTKSGNLAYSFRMENDFSEAAPSEFGGTSLVGLAVALIDGLAEVRRHCPAKRCRWLPAGWPPPARSSCRTGGSPLSIPR